MERVVQQGIAGGAGKHVWMLNSAGGTPFLTSLVLEKGSGLAEATRGVGMLSSQGGRPGMSVYDKFVERWKALDNPEDTEYISSRLPQYPDEPDFVGPTLDSAIYNDVDPSIYASIVFDETILMGLAACEAAAQHNDDTQIYINGTGTFQNILNTSFQGASGNIRVDQITGTRLPETAFFRLTNVIEEPVNETHVTFRVQESDAFIDGIWVKQENAFVFNDGTTHIPSDLPPLVENYNYIGGALRATGLAMAAVVLLCSLTFAAWTVHRRNVHVVKASQPIFLLLLCAGTFIMGSSIIPLSIDDEHISEDGCNMGCMAAPWLGSTGFALIFAALFSKTWRVNRLFHHPQMRWVKLSAFDVMKPLLLLLLLNVAVLAVWTAFSPLEWSREVTTEDAFGRPT